MSKATKDLAPGLGCLFAVGVCGVGVATCWRAIALIAEAKASNVTAAWIGIVGVAIMSLGLVLVVSLEYHASDPTFKPEAHRAALRTWIRKAVLLVVLAFPFWFIGKLAEMMVDNYRVFVLRQSSSIMAEYDAYWIMGSILLALVAVNKLGDFWEDWSNAKRLTPPRQAG